MGRGRNPRVGDTFKTLRSHGRSPLQHADFAPFRRLEMAIWDGQRLDDMRLLALTWKVPPNEMLVLPNPQGFEWTVKWDRIFFAWRGMLTPEEQARLQEHMEGLNQPTQLRAYRR